MALTPSNMLPLGTSAPEFALPDVSLGKSISLASFRTDQPLLVIFLCHHCPFVKHVKAELAALGRDFARKIGIVGISSNDPAVSAEDSPEGLKRMVEDWGLTFPVCYDESQDVAQAYQAACTPEVYLFDTNRRLVYRGQIDDSRPSNGRPVTGADIRGAIGAVLAGSAVSANQAPSIGCNIKWRAGKAPALTAARP
jgi:peroxiredoxin